ncbi:hypothetical protein BDW02DRAFT_575158 [Decorospora gaudefroyi]|uniref:Uncharacterized protein n=1 Tax=Decorospora gaudefroyi TaxID=184978 RepID=A0A6A5JV27_9PLEO|nr:hypothetical protein BDW02DRAFT_575158 [Decorospora gaudefroyi]
MYRCMALPKPVRTSTLLGPLHLDPDVSHLSNKYERDEYKTLALVAYVRPATLINHPPYVTVAYLVVEPTDEDSYVRIGWMELSELLIMAEGAEYRPKGEWREVTLV